MNSAQVWAKRWATALGGVVLRPCLWARSRCWACTLVRFTCSHTVPGFCLCGGGDATAMLATTQPVTRGWSDCPCGGGCPLSVRQSPRFQVIRPHSVDTRHRHPIVNRSRMLKAVPPCRRWAKSTSLGKPRSATRSQCTLCSDQLPNPLISYL
jgi:hypothetical protein